MSKCDKFINHVCKDNGYHQLNQYIQKRVVDIYKFINRNSGCQQLNQLYYTNHGTWNIETKRHYLLTKYKLLNFIFKD